MSSGYIVIRVDESTHLRIIITGLEIVERGLSLLGLTTIPDYALDTHTKPQGFRVGILRMYIDLQITNIVKTLI